MFPTNTSYAIKELLVDIILLNSPNWGLWKTSSIGYSWEFGALPRSIISDWWTKNIIWRLLRIIAWRWCTPLPFVKQFHDSNGTQGTTITTILVSIDYWLVSFFCSNLNRLSWLSLSLSLPYGANVWRRHRPNYLLPLPYSFLDRLYSPHDLWPYLSHSVCSHLIESGHIQMALIVCHRCVCVCLPYESILVVRVPYITHTRKQTDISHHHNDHRWSTFTSAFSLVEIYWV